MNTITYNRSIKRVRKESSTVFSCEASEIGLRPGDWPRFLETQHGNFVHHVCQRNGDGELLAVVYKNGATTLTVFND